MRGKELGYLAVAAVVLGGLLLFSGTENVEREQANVFQDLRVDAVQSVKIEVKDQQLVLRRSGGSWILPNRFQYPADANKVNSLLLKLFDVRGTQLVTTAEDKFERLGVGENSLKDGYAQVSLLGGEDRLLTGLKLGANRRQKGDEFSAGSAGQFVRRFAKSEVFTLPQPFTLSTAVADWIQSDLVSVLANDVISLKIFQLSDAGEPKLDIELKGDVAPRNPGNSFVPAALAFVGTIEPGKEVQQAVLGQLSSLLENVTVQDVVKKGDAAESALTKASRRAVLTTRRGIEYTIDLRTKDGAYYWTFRAQLAPETIAAVRDAAEKAASASSSSIAVAGQGASGQGNSGPGDPGRGSSPSSASSAGSTPGATNPAALNFATAEEVETLNKQFDQWTYVVPAFQGKKLEVTRTELVKPRQAPEKPQQ